MKYIRTDEYMKAIFGLSESKLYIVGAGKCGQILGKYFEKYKIPWIGYIDKDPELQQVNGKPVYPYGKSIDGYCIVSTYIHRKEIEGELRKSGIKSEQIIVYENQGIFFDIYDDLIGWKKYVEKTKIFCKKHKNEECFVIGNGPSLRAEDLEKLRNKVTFAANSIYALYSKTNWRPTYYCAGDAVFCKYMMSDKKNMVMLTNNCKAAFTSIMGEGMSYRDDIDNLYYMCLMTKKKNDELLCFSTNCSKQVYTGGTVTYIMLQLAAYMGFNQIYLLGMDFNYTFERHGDTIVEQEVLNHMEEIEEEEKKFYKAIYKRYGRNYLADVDLQLAGFQAAKKYADAHGIKIYNATRGGKLEVFPRVDFDSLFD